ncbi:MAG: hypothetical protein ABSE95_15970 [Thermodesulfobacteriota bacterium]|jgi:hypothetical protein
MAYWFVIRYRGDYEPHLYGPFNQKETAEKEQNKLWRDRQFGDDTYPPFHAETEEEAKQSFQFTGLCRQR